MGQDSKIQWTHHTFNPWRGCTKVSAGCANCYAEKMSGRNPKALGVWGPHGKRIVAAESYWKQPLKWNEEARAAGERRRVFCASLADVGEDWRGPMHRGTIDGSNESAVLWHRDDLGLVEAGHTTVDGSRGDRTATMQDVRNRIVRAFTPLTHLDLLLLTKRPENLPKFFPAEFLSRCWVGTSVEDQQRADERIPHLLRCPAAVRFLSCEPLLGEINIFRPHPTCREFAEGIGMDQAKFMGVPVGSDMPIDCWRSGRKDGLRWVIVGGESGGGSRPCVIGHVRSLVRQCKAAGVACFVKQLGAKPTNREGVPHPLKDPKGGDPSEWPEDLRVREFPATAKG